MISHPTLLLLGLTLVGLVALASASNFNKDLILTKSQKQKYDQFKAAVINKLPNEYYKRDVNIVRWLKAKNFDVKKATEMVNQHLKWRKEYKMDTIHNEDFSEFDLNNPIYTDGLDKEGRPMMVFSFGEWDLRGIAISGKLPKLIRYLIKKRDECVQKVAKLQAEGKNVTQWDFVMNLAGFTTPTHLCTSCFPIYTEFTFVYESNYPLSLDKIILINTPQVWSTVMTLINPILHPTTREIIEQWGTNKAEYEKRIFKDIDRNQLPSDFGGTKVYKRVGE